MAENEWTTGDKVVEALKVSVAVIALFAMSQNLRLDQFLLSLALEWHWGRFAAVGIAYLVTRNLFPSFRKMPLWHCLLWTFYGACILAVMSWANYGTYTEDADPLFGGGRTVVDFVPTEVERSLVGSRLFMDLLVPGLLGTYLSHRGGTGMPTSNWVRIAVKWLGLGIEGALFFLFGVGMLIGNGFVIWSMAGTIIDRAEVGWYLLWAVPLLLFSGAIFLALAIMSIAFLREWWTSRR